MELRSDVQKFGRKLRLIEYFASEEQGDEEDELIIRNPNNFCPPNNRNKVLDALINFMNRISLNHSKQPKPNLTSKQWNGINQLKNKNSIVIKETDKGGAVAIMNKEHYMRMVYSQHHDGVTYKRTDQSCDKKVMINLTKLVQKYHNSSTKKEIDYFTKFNFNTGNFHGLPKVHKLDKIAEAVNAQHSECIRVIEPDDLTLPL